MSEFSFPNHSNIFDDEFIPGKLQVYRNAHPLIISKGIPLQEMSENVKSQEILSLSLNEAKDIHLDSHLTSKHTCSTQPDSHMLSYSHLCIHSMASSIIYNPTPEVNQNSRPWFSINPREQELFNRLEPIQEEECKLLESSLNKKMENNQVQFQEMEFVSDCYEATNDLSQSIVVPPKTGDKLSLTSSFDPEDHKKIKTEKLQQDSHNSQGNNDNFKNKIDSELQEQEKMLIEHEENNHPETNPVKHNEENKIIEEKAGSSSIEFFKIPTEEKGICTEQIIPDVDEKGISCIPIVFDKGMCTEQIVPDVDEKGVSCIPIVLDKSIYTEQIIPDVDEKGVSCVPTVCNQGVCTEQVITTVLEKGISCVPVVFDKEINTDEILIIEEFVESRKGFKKANDDDDAIIQNDLTLETYEMDHNFQEETIQELQELRILKHHYLSQLSDMKTKIKKMKNKQLKMKENIYNSMKQTLKSLSELLDSNLNNYFLQRLKTQKENVLAYKIKVSKLKKELDDLKTTFIGVTEKVKKEITNIIKEDTKKQISKIIEESIKETIQEPERDRKYTDLLDNHSITTNSSPTTPMKISTVSETPTTIKERKSSNRKHRRDPAILEGMLYLLGSGSLNNPFKEKEDFRKTFENFIKVNESSKLTDDLILSSLIERTRGDEEKTLKQKSSASKSDLIMSTINQKENDSITKDSLKSGKESITKKVKRS